MIDSGVAAISRQREAKYPSLPPFNPSVSYPEYPFTAQGMLDGDNLVYDSVREVFQLLELDEENLGTERWNPLGAIISPGDHVVIKPNFVIDNGHWECAVTHGSVIRALLDYVFLATGRNGRIVIADTPLAQTNFSRLAGILGLQSVVELYQSVLDCKIGLFDLRPNMYRVRNGVIVGETTLEGDPLGSTVVDLGRSSELNSIARDWKRYRILNFPTDELTIHHNLDVNEYCISNTILDADVVINVPKLKTHIKAGVTVALKNMIGINVRKEFLVHHRAGAPEQGGDEYPIASVLKRLERKALDLFADKPLARRMTYPFLRVAKKVVTRVGRRQQCYLKGANPYNVRAGAWFGNDTLWRTILDVNKIVFFADKRGRMTSERQRTQFILVDGILGGEGAGPLEPEPVESGILVAGYSPISVDMVCSRLMGFDYGAIPHIAKASAMSDYLIGSCSPKNVATVSNRDSLSGDLEDIKPMRFAPAPGWGGHIEAGSVA